MIIKKHILFFILGSCSFGAYSQQATRASEELKEYVTYPFSDPDPIASPQKLYPYFRFDGFAHKSEKKQWKAVILENDFIRVQIMPEIGGKIWSAYDKVNKRHYIYNNDVVKFRDIAMRGPWTSGGIEANYGIIGHTPNTSTPVDYRLQQNEDGSASCFLHAFDLLSRSNWTLEVRLDKDKDFFSTRSFWYNTNTVEQPYYTWMNLAVPAGSDLRFLYPGNKYIGHDGDTHPWPIDAQGRDLSLYTSNDFGSSKSYHVLGAHSNSFGVYYEKEDHGMMRYALREDKVGKKIFLWSQAKDGQIWEGLLTDQNGQYVEIQSGRLFNQNVASSSLTPFKQIGFAPYQSDSWTEYWMPFSGIGVPDDVQPSAALKVSKDQSGLHITLDPKRVLRDSVYLLDQSGAVLASDFAHAERMLPIRFTFDRAGIEKARYLKIGPDYFDILREPSEKTLARPDELERTVSSDNEQMKVLEVRDLIRFRLYKEAEARLNSDLQEESASIDLLIEKSKLAWFKMDYESCFQYSRAALARDTYHPAANYYYGLSALQLGQVYDGLDGFEIASLDVTWRSAAYTQLAKYYYGIRQYQRAYDYALKAEQSQAMNVYALQIQYLAGQQIGAMTVGQPLETLKFNDPFNAFVQFESGQTITSHQEMGNERLLELAVWYHGLKEDKKAREVLLQISVPNTEVLLWLAWLSRADRTESARWLSKAMQSNPIFVFPFREESLEVFQWGREQGSNWKVDYLAALLYRFHNQEAKALALLNNVYTIAPDFAPFYAVRAEIEKSHDVDKAIQSMRQAIAVDPDQWRYGLLLTQLLNHKGMYSEALGIINTEQRKHKDNYILGLTRIRTQLLNQAYKEAEKSLTTIQILPFEGANESHRYFVQTKLMLAFQHILDKDYKQARHKLNESRTWPSNLGVGEPYESEKNELLADWLMAYVSNKTGDTKAQREYLNKIVANKKTTNKLEKLLQHQAMSQLGDERKVSVLGDDYDVALLKQIQNDELSKYWSSLIKNIYFVQDQRMF